MRELEEKLSSNLTTRSVLLPPDSEALLLTEDRRVSVDESVELSLDDFIQRLTGEDNLKPLKLK